MDNITLACSRAYIYSIVYTCASRARARQSSFDSVLARWARKNRDRRARRHIYAHIYITRTLSFKRINKCMIEDFANALNVLIIYYIYACAFV